MLIKGLVKNPNKKKLINNRVMSLFPTIEQVGFYDFNPKTKIAILEMAGGEFCGNATRSLAYLLLERQKGEINAKVSGVNQILRAGIKRQNYAFAQIPAKNLFVKKLGKKLFRIDLEGITHLICLNKTNIDSSLKIKSKALEILEKENLISSIPAAGVMFIQECKDLIKLKPVVWVRDIESTFYETACASGTAAVGIWAASLSQKPSIRVRVLQPSGKIIRATVKSNPFEVYIDGPIEILQKGSEKI